jgi:hypothetical protein
MKATGAVTGEVHLKPVPVVVLLDQGKDIPKDTIVFALIIRVKAMEMYTRMGP